MNQKELFLRDVVARIGDKVGKQATAEKVEQLAKHGTLFLFSEIMNLRIEVEKLKEELER